ncbi:MAG: DUF4430 domain-containing protein [Eubacterium sp.]|nr:DUF4430 domain-containing protein [Eubacterium sp.]
MSERSIARKPLAVITAAALALSIMPKLDYALAAEELGSVRVIVRNDTFVGETYDEYEEEYVTPAWSGVLLDEWVELSADSSMLSAVLQALEENGISQTGGEYGYISEIGGLAAEDCGWLSGWMGTLNDWFTDDLFNAYTVENGGLTDGDEICLMYTLDLGQDIGYDWTGSTDTSLKSIGIEDGTLSPAFSADTKSYTLTLTEGIDEIYIRPEALNKNFKVEVKVDGKSVKRSRPVGLKDSSIITVTVDGENTYTVTVSLPKADTLGSVRVIVRNDTFTEKDGSPAWTGVLLDEWTELSADSNALSVLLKALEENGISQTGGEYGYITEIGGLSAGDCGYMSGWMGTLNDWFTDETFTAYTVANGKLSDGDEICMMYSLDWGLDIGSDWSGTDTSLKSIGIDEGTLSPAFSADMKSYTLTLDEGIDEIYIRPEAVNKNFRVEVKVDGKSVKRSRPVSVNDGSVIVITVDGTNTYTVTVNGTPSDEPPTDDSPANEEPTGSKTPWQDIYKTTAETLSDIDITALSEAGGDWIIVGLVRAGLLSDTAGDKYIADVTETVKLIGSDTVSRKATDNARVAIALAAVGADPADIAGYDLLKPLTDIDFVTRQGINGAIYALIALDAADYEADACDALIAYILDAQVNGGWALVGETPDPDVTAMALQALAPYYDDEKVKAAVDEGVQILQGCAYKTTESVAQAIIALTALDIDPAKLIDVLAAAFEGKGFVHVPDGEYNQMATEQAFLALVAYSRYLDGQPSLYDIEIQRADDAVPGNSSGNADDPEADANKPSENPATGGALDCTAAVIAAACAAIAITRKKK